MEIRKIQTEEEMEKKRKRNSLILSIVMISILVFSTAGYFSLREDDASSSGDNRVENIGDSWILRYGDQIMQLSNSPESAKNVSISLFKSISDYSGKTVYIASESDPELYEISSTLGRYIDRLQPACYGKCDKDLPEKNCNETMIVIRSLNISENSKGRVYESDNCVFIEGDLIAVDAFIYNLFRIN